MQAVDYLFGFRQKLAEREAMLIRAHSQNAISQYILTEQERSATYAKCFLDIHIAYEEFMESITIYYLLGGNTQTGSPIVRYVSPLDANHANAILIGSNRYFDWTNATLINKVLKLYLKDGGPILPAYNGIQAILSEIKIVRNGCAHFSSTTQTPLAQLYTKLTGITNNAVSIAELLSATDPTIPTRNIYQRYQSVLDLSAEAMTM